MTTKKITKILIANRGEIALRVIQTAREMGIKTVTLYSDEEVGLPHCLAGDESFSLGSGPLKETYLNQDKIIAIARSCGADAVHPGYGFLSEKSSFAKKVKDAGLIFIGPSPESIDLMGDKKTSKIKIQELGVPSIPGYHGDNQEISFLIKEAKKIGLPVLIKASAGGGGKGMRIVYEENEFQQALEGAKREAMNAFGDDTVLLEKYITSPRHIEIQVMSDRHGNHFHLYERECSIQRRYQKIVEESPSSAVSPELRAKMTEAAIKITRGINYEGAGTIELILDTDGSFYFLEMNTRLQVEHPVTEMVTGLDLVRLQIMVAQGDKLPFTQNDIKQRGHAIEVRLYAEDPDNGFLPSIGTIKKIGKTTVRDTRLDCGYVDGNAVTISFDPMLAKLISWGESREVAAQKLNLALNDILFLGLRTNRDYLKRILTLPEFLSGTTYTHFVKTYEDKLQKKQASKEQRALAVAAFLLKKDQGKSVSSHEFKTNSVWERLSGFRNI
ncbi:ATP-grasp domain-containing protein [Bacteriovorax stolpii]|uniref:Biotin carboxylase n=1 Tax=Bacteriovorax stolpii TaxID=960 RepID=A0A2K9NRH1_BACTC|nr:biotin carboxylase N-terminal domain-containing protein [Bacteriovorax stolpii]AUN98101.1 biotin carboxylase [Bacteriovorax stolpii]QDK41919.1 ATP-grasp domain-containing protein [Bacteriovorax stolpii]